MPGAAHGRTAHPSFGRGARGGAWCAGVRRHRSGRPPGAMYPQIVAEPVMRHNGRGKPETIGHQERVCRTTRPTTRRGSAGRSGRSARPLDDADRRILGELVRDARTSIRTLAERIHISRANAYARVDRLLADGVITGFSARISPERAGLGTSAYVSLSIEQNSWREVSAPPARAAVRRARRDARGRLRRARRWSGRRTTPRCATWCSSRSRACPASRRRGRGWCSTSSRGAAPTGPDAARPEPAPPVRRTASADLVQALGSWPADLAVVRGCLAGRQQPGHPDDRAGHDGPADRLLPA